MANRSGPHSALLGQLEQYIALQGGWTLRIAGGIGQRKGSPDMACFIVDNRGWPVFFVVEAKTGRAVQSVDQLAMQCAIETYGGIYLLVRSVDMLEDMLLPLGLVKHRLTDRRVG